MIEKKIDTWLNKAQEGLYYFAAIALIIGMFYGLGLLHVKLGGFETPSGTLVGIAWIFLFFSPIIDRLIGLGEWLAQWKWFLLVRRVVRIGKLAFQIAAGIGALLLLLHQPTRENVAATILEVVEIVFR